MVSPTTRAALRELVLAELRALGVGPTHRLGVGCSGGPDSAVLADIAMALARDRVLGPVILLHVDHGLRPDSAADGDVVRALAAAGQGGVQCVRVAVDRSRSSLERAAREARYAAFERAADELALDWIALAHTASDQAETVLMRLLRGTGVAGLAAIPARRGRYVRPLLGIARERIEQYVTDHQLDVVRDPMNQDMTFLRTRIRHHWLPALRRENPRLDRALCQVASSAAQDREVLDFAARQLLLRAEGDPDSRRDGRRHGLRVVVLAEAPDAVMHRALALCASDRGCDLEARHQRAVADLVRRDTAGTLSLDLPGLRAVREYDILRFEVPGDGDGTGDPSIMDDVMDDIAVDVAGPDGPYRVRYWRAGDRMRPTRLGGRSRKLSDLFGDAKVARRLRARARIVVRERDGVIEWAEHIGPAHGSRVRVTLTSQSPVASNNISD